MRSAEVYADELVSYNPITGECRFVDDFSACKFRNEGKTDKIIGYYAWFRLRSGFTKELYILPYHQGRKQGFYDFPAAFHEW